MSPNPSETVGEFDGLALSIASSGLVPEADWTSVMSESAGNPIVLSDLLTSRNLLTAFQLEAFQDGRASSLRVGNYDLLDRLGAGGMGTVYKARHRRMKRIVALKVLAANLSQNTLFVKRFQREVETIAALGHPNIVMAYDADEDAVGHFLVMECVSGRDLADHVRKNGPLPVASALDCLLQTARGLAYAHAQGIIHRDIKPHNLLLDDSGVVKITDLGLARLSGDADGVAARSEVTMAGGVIGTADYMPPEQAIDSTTIDHRADIYSLGCTLHFLLTGRPPYSAPTLMALLFRHRDAEIPNLSQARADIPPGLNDLFKEMLAKKVEDRVQQMSDVVSRLEELIRRLPTTDSPAAPSANLEPGDPSRSQDSTVTVLPADQPGAATIVVEPVALPSVLVVEPSRVQGSIIKGYLEEHSLPVVDIVTNAGAAMDAVRRHKPQVVVSTMHLPDTSGVALASRIHGEIPSGAPGFVLLTSEAENAESVSLSKVNQILLLHKPFTAQQLFDAACFVNRATGGNGPKAAGTGIGPANRQTKTRDMLKVMIVDDSTVARMHVRSILEELGFKHFVEATDGAFAIAAAAQEQCDLIVTDYNMPLMDGRALVSYLKQNPATSGIPIVMVTTETEPRVLDPVRALGVAAIIEKAFPVQIVRTVIDGLF